MDKRTLLAVVLAVLVMLLYSSMVQKFYPASQGADPSFQQQIAGVPVTLPTVSSTVSSSTVSSTTVSSTVSSVDAVKLSGAGKKKILADNVEYELSDIGGCITSINIKKYNHLEQKIPELIYSAEFLQDSLFSLSGLVEPAETGRRYQYSSLPNGAEYSVALTNGLEIKKTYKADSNYGLLLELKIINSGVHAIRGRYSIIAASNINASVPVDARFIQAIVSQEGKQKRIGPSSVKQQGFIYPGNVDWVAMQNKYFSLAVKPYQPTVSSTVSQTVSYSSNRNISIELQYDIDLEPMAHVLHKFLLYSGPNNPSYMALYQAGIENSVSYGIFGNISKLLLFTLRAFYKMTHNYGVAIILLALLISLLLYPLSLRSFKSMKQMQLLQPKIEKLRKEYKDNPQKLNKEMLELYKKHKVNPFGGCLPMLLQMPIFIALYQALVRAIELKNARFLWIKDLSGPDRAFILPLSSTGGAGFPVNILPILMAITMFLQQKLLTPHSATSDSGDTMQQQQKMMLVLMPVLFGFIFYNMPSGLVLYWFLNTLIMFFQQARITKSFHVEKSSVA